MSATGDDGDDGGEGGGGGRGRKAIRTPHRDMGNNRRRLGPDRLTCTVQLRTWACRRTDGIRS